MFQKGTHMILLAILRRIEVFLFSFSVVAGGLLLVSLLSADMQNDLAATRTGDAARLAAFDRWD